MLEMKMILYRDIMKIKHVLSKDFLVIQHILDNRFVTLSTIQLLTNFYRSEKSKFLQLPLKINPK